MSRIAWLSDLHLDHASEAAIGSFLTELKATAADFVLIGGDTGEAANFGNFLTRISGSAPGQVCFVLGNHDYYRSSVHAVRTGAEELTDSDIAWWLPAKGIVELTPQTALVGHGGWGDARIGDIFGTNVFLADYVLIEELRQVATPNYMTDELVQQLNRFGDDAAARLRASLEDAAAKYAEVIVLTHVPSFREACWYEGRISDDNWAPHFTCKAMGDMLLEVARASPRCNMTVLCGHTHGEGVAEVLPNLTVRTAEATYGSPRVYSVFDV